VNLTIGNTSDQMVQLMKTGRYDVVSASGDATLRLVYGGQVAPINTKLITTWPQIYSDLKDTEYNSVGGVSYGVPQGRGANLLLYSTKEFSAAPTSWAAVFDPAQYASHKGRITDYDSPIYIADAALYLMRHQPSLGIKNPYALDTAQLAAAVGLLKTQHSAVAAYWSNYLDEVNAFESGDDVVGTTWQVIQNTLAADGKAATRAVMPSEGATGWSDTWMISSAKSAHVNCAYKWLNYISSAQVNGHVAGYFGEAAANSQACGEAARESGISNFCDIYHAGDPSWWKNVYLWTTPISKCLDGRTDVKCTDYAAWQSAWTEIKS
jgi:putative spermidine/putrescine transport system substrate-binding protein